ncbi:putative transposase [Allorhodopirellula heiligendammensis]|uniref:Transposase n=1 Tax=Allorhodopirellula heiligendammensis TaxID=2714739 RepID=A0A5C6C727_9BACT|nr:putative transposase [Allorhodopirellula heiligendammensis]
MIDTSVWQRRWSVDSEAVGDGKAAMAYLAPYVIRGAVSNWRVDWCDDADSLDEAHCRLQVKRSGTRQYRPMALSVQEFIRRWLQHVLPAGLHRVRHYGFLHSSSRRSLKELRILIAVSLGQVHYLVCHEQIVMPESNAMLCPVCGGLASTR